MDRDKKALAIVALVLVIAWQVRNMCSDNDKYASNSIPCMD